MGKNAFTIVETLIAVTILTGAIVVLYYSWSGSLLGVRRTNQLSTVSMLLKQKITEFEQESKNMGLGEIREEDKGDFGKDFTNYRWEIKSQELKLPDLSAGLSSREGGVTEMEKLIVKTFSDFLVKAVKEIKITVFVKAGKREVGYPATIYKVDYDLPIGLPGGS